MVGSTGTLMTMRLVRSKLRKREETSSVSPATIEAAQTTTYATTPQQNGHLNGSAKKQLTTSASDSNVVLSNTGNGTLNNLNASSDPSFNSSNQNSVWVFPPLPPQPNIYNCNNNIVSRVSCSLYIILYICIYHYHCIEEEHKNRYDTKTDSTVGVKAICFKSSVLLRANNLTLNVSFLEYCLEISTSISSAKHQEIKKK